MSLSTYEPDLYVDSIYDLDFNKLKKAGINAYLFDLDNTLVVTDHPESPPELVQLFKTLEAKGIKILILSNNSKKRVAEFSEPLGLPYIGRAFKPFASCYKRALEMLGTSASETAMVGDQRMTDVRGGNLNGLYTILVKSISEKEAGTTKINRFFEGFVVKMLKKRGLYKQEES